MLVVVCYVHLVVCCVVQWGGGFFAAVAVAAQDVDFPEACFVEGLGYVEAHAAC